MHRFTAMISPASRFVRTNLWSMAAYGLYLVASRGVDFVTALIIVRGTPPAQFAIYSAAISTIPALAWMFASGMAPILQSIVGQNIGEKRLAAHARQAARRAALRANLWPALFGAALTGFLLFRLNAPPTILTFAVLAVIGTAAAATYARIDEVLLQLFGRTPFVGRGTLVQAMLRLALVGTIAAAGLSSAGSAALTLLVINLAATLGYAAMLASATQRTIGPRGDDREAIEDIGRSLWLLRRQSLPLDGYMALSSQFFVWVLAAMGTVQSVAEFGALTRLGQLLFPITFLLGSFVVPAFAQLRTRNMMPHFATVLLVVSAVLAVPILICVFLPQAVLFILGPQYSQLTGEVALYAAGIAAYVLSDTADHLVKSRGRVMPAWLSIAVDSAAFVLPIIVTGEVSLHSVLLAYLWVHVVRTLRLVVFASLTLAGRGD